MYLFASFIGLYFIFGPAIHILYYSNDDYHYVLGGFGKSCHLDDGFYFMKTLGRPLQAYIDCMSFQFAYTLEAMRMLRLTAVILLASIWALLTFWFHSLNIKISIAFFAAGCLILIQHLYGDTVPMGAICLPITVLLTFAAYLCVNRSHSYKNKLKWMMGGGVLLLCALLIYPAMAFFFVTLMLTKVLFSPLKNWTTTRRAIVQEVLFFCVLCLVYFLWAYYNMHYHASSPVSQAYQLDHPNLNILDMLKRLIIFWNVFNFPWNIAPFTDIVLQGRAIMVLLIGGSLTGGITFFTSDFYKRSPYFALSCLSQAAIVVILLLILSSTFFLVIPSLSLIENRILFGSITAGLVVIFWSICQFSRLMPDHLRHGMTLMVFVILFVIAGYQANINMMLNAIKHQRYLNKDIKAVESYLSQGQPLRRIHFIIPTSNYPYDRYTMAYAAVTRVLGPNRYDVEWCSLPRGNPGQEKDHQQEAINCINQLPVTGMGVTYSYENDPFIKTNNMLVIQNHYEG